MLAIVEVPFAISAVPDDACSVDASNLAFFCFAASSLASESFRLKALILFSVSEGKNFSKCGQNGHPLKLTIYLRLTKSKWASG